MNFKKCKNIFLVMFVPALFLIIGIKTLSDYGINWDEPKHFARGQAYLHFVLTGFENYLNIPRYPTLKGTFDSSLEYESTKSLIAPDEFYRRSYYQSDLYTFDFLLKNEYKIPDLHGHPEGNDFLAAVFNKIFYQKLNLLGDIESYHLFEIFVSFLLVAGVSYFVYVYFGIFASFVSSASLAMYPLFFSESHFNIKDPPEAAFFGLTIIFFYLGMVNKKRLLILLSAVFAGLAFSTKLNAIFILPVLFLWTFFYNRSSKHLIPILILCSVVAFIVFFSFWPLLWFSPVEVMTNMINYYKDIGLNKTSVWNLYPITWIIYTTPIPVLILSLIGVFHSIINIKKLNGLYFIVLSWLILTILRVTLPNTNIYGGVRQIMEYIPALTILAGIGAYSLTTCISKKSVRNFLKVVIVIMLSFVFYENLKLHPNQNVYFNGFVGGLEGAMKIDLPYWGNSYGNAYMQGVNWINENAQTDAKLAIAVGNMVNVPRIKLRDDIDFSNDHWSGPLRKGEYVMELYFDWDPRLLYAYSYYDKFLDPVHEVKVDGVPILKIWKNDLDHTKKGYEAEVVYTAKNVTRKDDNSIILDMGRTVNVTRLEIIPSVVNCRKTTDGYVALSDSGSKWDILPERIGGNQMRIDPIKFGISKDSFVYFIAAQSARYIMIDTENPDSCLLKSKKIKVSGII